MTSAFQPPSSSASSLGRFPNAKNNNLVLLLHAFCLILWLVSFISTVLLTHQCSGAGVNLAWACFVPTSFALLGVTWTSWRGTVEHYKDAWRPLLAVSLALSLVDAAITGGTGDCYGYSVFQRTVMCVIAVIDAVLLMYLATNAHTVMGRWLQTGYTKSFKYEEALRSARSPYADPAAPGVGTVGTVTAVPRAPVHTPPTPVPARRSPSPPRPAAVSPSAPAAAPTGTRATAPPPTTTTPAAAPDAGSMAVSTVALSHATTRARALYTYDANPDDPNELSFKKHDVLVILDRKGKWWQARTADGAFGIAPSNYLELLAEEA